MNTEQHREFKFEPDLAYNLDSHRATEDGIIDGVSLASEIKRDLQEFASSIIIDDKQVRTLYIQIAGASIEEEGAIASYIIAECRKLNERIQDIEVRCENFEGDIQVTGSLSEELGKLGFRASEDSNGLTQFKLQNYHQAIRFQIHKKEEEAISKNEARQIADYIVSDIFKAVESWTPGTKLNLHIYSHNTRPMHQDLVKDIFNQVFKFALQELTTEYSREVPPLIPNIQMHLTFVDEMFANGIYRITYQGPDNTENNETGSD